MTAAAGPRSSAAARSLTPRRIADELNRQYLLAYTSPHSGDGLYPVFACGCARTKCARATAVATPPRRTPSDPMSRARHQRILLRDFVSSWQLRAHK
jgi:hypothetical protein